MGAGHAKVSNNNIIEYLQKCPISILDWQPEMIQEYTSCFKMVKVKAGEEVKTVEKNTFFVVAKGGIEVIAILPTIQKKTDNIREFLCKKKQGDMVYIPSVKHLISESNKREMSSREQKMYGVKREHKNILDMIDSVNIIANQDSSLLMLNWDKYKTFEASAKEKGGLDVAMLNALMQTNIADYLARLPFLKIVPAGKLEILSSMCQYELANQDKIICKEGEMGDKVYMILSGNVKVTASPGTLGITTQEEPARKPQNRRGSVMKQENKLSSADPFMPNSKKRDSLLHQLHKMGNSMGKLIKPGDETDAALAAIANAQKKDSNNTIELATLNDGEYFGEMAAFIELPRAATVTTTSSCLFATLSKSDFRSFMKVVPNMQNSIEFMVKQHMLQNLIQLKSPFLESVSIAKAHGMASKSNIESYKKGDIIFKEGDTAQKFYFVYSGSLDVEKTKEGTFQVVGHLYPGDYFGELALINDNPRLATITAAEPTIVLCISKDHFHDCFENKPDLLSEFIVRMNGRKVELRVLLDHKRSREAFVEHLQHEHGSENLKFYELVKHFEKNFVYMSDDEALSSAEKIVDDFIKPDAEDCVNLPSKIAEVIIEAVKVHDLHDDTFSKAKEEIYNLMNRDLYQRFKNSEAFDNLMKRLHTYEDIDVDFTA
mmetsp:Transcript_3277/g.6674  ORF Transcript_3277/g.6674 Transcript_3277/m.6674 type:complete len:659 (+) Transcript_3277:197-2173(+)|eukprot:CAMPEP_0118644284 /NCGR_PEP_ID=MMETSP0785-20121206/6861_1 /TAXON_ID=91992 /ORGANISM="Bolidomonas pacifica, Strain CCMP 1866" /LENGTH=658 /DNA_ID=CAMNT_0006536041 /DNA_START=166 /DNA_END=2142 /DNA_ORIENTATION=+